MIAWLALNVIFFYLIYIIYIYTKMLIVSRKIVLFFVFNKQFIHSAYIKYKSCPEFDQYNMFILTCFIQN